MYVSFIYRQFTPEMVSCFGTIPLSEIYKNEHVYNSQYCESWYEKNKGEGCQSVYIRSGMKIAIERGI